MIVALNLLLTFEPGGHLRVLVTPISGTVSVLRHVDVEPLSVFGVVVVHSAEQLDGRGVVAKCMEFGYVKVLTGTEFNEDAAILVKAVEGII